MKTFHLFRQIFENNTIRYYYHRITSSMLVKLLLIGTVVLLTFSTFTYYVEKKHILYKEVNGVKGETENLFDMYYKWLFNDYLSVTNDIQIIQNPFGNDASNGNSTVFVCGIRTQISF